MDNPCADHSLWKVFPEYFDPLRLAGVYEKADVGPAECIEVDAHE
jgi:hypothetical protein